MVSKKSLFDCTAGCRKTENFNFPHSTSHSSKVRPAYIIGFFGHFLRIPQVFVLLGWKNFLFPRFKLGEGGGGGFKLTTFESLWNDCLKNVHQRGDNETTSVIFTARHLTSFPIITLSVMFHSLTNILPVGK